MAKLNVQVFNSINEIDPSIWDRIVARRGFQSHHWYQFGERAMADCQPTYLVAWNGKPYHAAFGSNEPLPLPEVNGARGIGIQTPPSACMPLLLRTHPLCSAVSLRDEQNHPGLPPRTPKDSAVIPCPISYLLNNTFILASRLRTG
jgi:hypothetical protein